MLLLIMLGLAACDSGDSSNPSAEDELPPVTVAIDPSIHPNPPHLFDEDEGMLLPLAVIADPDGESATFVANRLIVQTDDQASLNALLGRYGGQILEAIHPAADGMPDLPPLYLIEVNVNTATFDALAADLTALGGDEEGIATGHHRISSVEGAKLLAIAAAEARRGHTISIEWLMRQGAIPESTAEAETGEFMGTFPYTRDVYQWPHFTRDTSRETVQRIGVPEAWSLLHKARELSNRVRIAILDSGFATNEDFPTMSPVPEWCDLFAAALRPRALTVTSPGMARMSLVLPWPCQTMSLALPVRLLLW